MTITLVEVQTSEGWIWTKSAGVVLFYLYATHPPLRITLKMWRVHSGLASKVPVTPFKVSLRLQQGGSTGEGVRAPPRFVASYCRFVALRMQIWDSKKQNVPQILASKNPRDLGSSGHHFWSVFCRFVVLSLCRFAIWDNLSRVQK